MKTFTQNIHQYYPQILQESKRFNQSLKNFTKDFKQISKIQNQIEKIEDITKLIAINYIEMWEVSVKQMQNLNQIAHKDDVLIDVIDLYIKQKITFQQGNQQLNNTNNEELNNIEQIGDALKQII
ncbi:hypothetical protein ABPG72_010696 [Tetrahymena utriculariae]